MTFCFGIDKRGTCPLRDDCYRHTMPTRARDSFGAMPYSFDSKSCDHFISNIPSEDFIRVSAYYVWMVLGKPEGQSETIWLHARRSAEESFGRKPHA